MAEYIAPIQRLIEEFRKLPGVGAKTAARYAFAVLNFSDEEASRFSDAINSVKRDVHKCPICNGYSTSIDGCDICKNEGRDRSLVCVVEMPKRNKTGNSILGKILGLKKFIEVSEENKLAIKNAREKGTEVV